MSSSDSSSPGHGVSILTDDVAALGRYAYETAEAMRSALASAATEVNALLDGDWTGTAADGFGNGWHECHDGGMTVLAALTEMADMLGVNATTYQAHDAAVASDLYPVNL